MRTKEKDNGIVLLKLSLYCISLWISLLLAEERMRRFRAQEMSTTL